MGRKMEMPSIETVEFYYGGTDKQFNDFLKAVIKDYVADDRLQPEVPDEEKETA